MMANMKPSKTSDKKKPGSEKEAARPAPASKAEPSTETRPGGDDAFVQRQIDDRGGNKPRRMSFNVSDDGQVDWAGMKDGNRKELFQTLANDPELRKAFGMAADAEEDFKITDIDIKKVLGWLTTANGFAARLVLAKMKKFEIRQPIIDAVYKLDGCISHATAEKSCVACQKKNASVEEMTLRGTRLANKYCGEWIKTHIDEVFFLAIYFDMVGEQAKLAITSEAYTRVKEGEAAKAKAVEQEKQKGPTPVR